MSLARNVGLSGRAFPGQTRTPNTSEAGCVIAKTASIADRFSIAINCALQSAPTLIAASAICFAAMFSKTLLMLQSKEIGQ